jgi:hypothetical protein
MGATIVYTDRKYKSSENDKNGFGNIRLNHVIATGRLSTTRMAVTKTR